MKFGIIESGKLKGRRAILEPRVNLPSNIFLIEKGAFMNGAPMYAKYCLTKGCEMEVSEKCTNCNEQKPLSPTVDKS